MAQRVAIVAELKRALKEQGLTYAAVAGHLKLSVATVKRVFSTGDFTLDRIDRICALLDIEVSQLIEKMREREVPVTRLKLAQEKEIVADPRLFLMTWLVINRWRLPEILETFRFTAREAERYLIKLDRLKIIELQPGNRARLRVSRNLTWHPRGPIQQLVNQKLLKEFLSGDFTDSKSEFRFYASSLSTTTQAHIKRAIQNVMRECAELAERDVGLPLNERNGVAYLFALREWQYSGFDAQRV